MLGPETYPLTEGKREREGGFPTHLGVQGFSPAASGGPSKLQALTFPIAPMHDDPGSI